MTTTSSPDQASARPTAITGESALPRPTALERLTRSGVTVLGTLPGPLMAALTRRRTSVDEQTLEREVQLALAVLGKVGGIPFEKLPLPQGRRQIDVEAWQFGGTPLPVGSVRELEIPGPNGPIPARLYLPSGAGPNGAPLPARSRGLLVNYHGGGFVLGSLASHDPICRFLCSQAGVAVLNVGYRLAPEHPFPEGYEDAIAAYAWAAEDLETLGLADRIGVCGDSAGGNLAAAVAQAARDRGLRQPDLQVLLSPWLDLSGRRESRALFADGYFLTAAQLDWYTERYLGRVDAQGRPTALSTSEGATADGAALASEQMTAVDGAISGPGAATADETDPRVSPLLAEDLSGLAPAYIAYAGFDPLRDESRAYAERLREAGVPVTERCHTGHIHPFSNVLGVGRTGIAAAREIAQAVREGLRV